MRFSRSLFASSPPPPSLSHTATSRSPAFLAFPDPTTGATTYSLWVGGVVHTSTSLYGPFAVVSNFSYPGVNPAPVHHNGTFVFTNDFAALTPASGFQPQAAAHPLLRYRVQGGSAALFDGAPPDDVLALGRRVRPSLVDLFVALTRRPEINRTQF